MNKKAYIQLQLQLKAISNVPLHIYEQDFTFIVNHREFKTSRIISDILSPKICQQHLNDPTFDTFIINTHNKGHFSHILSLVKFNLEELPENELPFISEVLELLGNKTTKILTPTLNVEITLDTVFESIKLHEKGGFFYSEKLRKEIEFISSHFFELTESQEEKISQLSTDTIERIIGNHQLQLKDENQLINFINKLYLRDRKNSKLYEFVYFSFVDENQMSEFVDIFDINDITREIWSCISYRLKEKIIKNNDGQIDEQISIENEIENSRYKNRIKTFLLNNNNEFDGIINHLRHESKGGIQNVIDITASSLYSSHFSPYNVCLFEEQNKYFHSNNEQDSWICFDFKEHKIIPSCYIVKSIPYSQNSNHPKSWVIEGSDDKSSWEVLDEVNNCSYLNGECLTHTFNINKQILKGFRFVRMRQTSNNWYRKASQFFFTLGSLEFYGTLD